MPDYVIAIEGSEPMRIFQGAKEDLHETVFLVLDEGLTLDLAEVKFVEATEDTEARVEFHFPREVGGASRDRSAIREDRVSLQSFGQNSASWPAKRTVHPVAISSSRHARQWRARPVIDARRIQIRFLPSHIVLHY